MSDNKIINNLKTNPPNAPRIFIVFFHFQYQKQEVKYRILLDLETLQTYQYKPAEIDGNYWGHLPFAIVIRLIKVIIKNA